MLVFHRALWKMNMLCLSRVHMFLRRKFAKTFRLTLQIFAEFFMVANSEIQSCFIFPVPVCKEIYTSGMLALEISRKFFVQNCPRGIGTSTSDFTVRCKTSHYITLHWLYFDYLTQRNGEVYVRTNYTVTFRPKGKTWCPQN